MPDRFCSSCGTRRPAGARFCTACGTPLPAASPARPAPLFERWAPVLVAGSVLAVGAIAVIAGVVQRRPVPTVPGSGGSRSAAAQFDALPQGHPPIELPQDVRDMIAQATREAASKPGDVELWRRAAEMQYRASRIDRSYLTEAEKSYREILKLRPQDPGALLGLGNIAYDREDPEAAIRYFEKYLAQRPEDLDARTDLGTMYLARRDPQRAAEIYRDVLGREPRHFQAQFNLAVALRWLGDEEGSRKALERARDIAPDETTRERIETLLARLAAPGSDTAAAAGSMRDDVERVFRRHPILGPKIDRIEWPSSGEIRVVVRDFPMQSMPGGVREKFLARLRSGVEAARVQHRVQEPVRASLVDAASGTLLARVEAGPENDGGARGGSP